MEIYIVAVVIALVLISILFFALKSTVKRIDHNTKKYFIDKLQDYDYLIEEKQNQLKDLNKEIEENKKILSEIKNKNMHVEVVKPQKYYNDVTIPKYEDDKIFKKYKNIKEKFSLNFVETIKDFVKKHSDEDNSAYYKFVEIRNKFSDDMIFEIMNLKPHDQESYITEILGFEQIRLINEHIRLNKFDINKFISKLDTLIEKNDPTIYVLTGNEKKNYDFISDNVKTVIDRNINEGIKISYKGNLYDYSL